MSIITTSQNWISRLGGSIKGIIFGVLLLIVAIVLLFWNEGRAVKMNKALNEGQGVVVSANIDSVDPAQDGKFVHLSGQLETDDILTDDEFDVVFGGIKLERLVEMYQWQEQADSSTIKKMGGSTETVTTYSYNKAWDENMIDSSSFHDQGYDNPGLMAFQSDTLVASDVQIGKFQLSNSLINKINNYTDLPIEKLKDGLSTEIGRQVNLVGGVIYIGTNQGEPQIGDLKISYRAVNPSIISLISQQNGNSFTPFITSKGKSLEFLELGNKTSEQMFATAHSNNKAMLWIVRLVGFLMVMISIRIILKPFEIMGDVVPFIGGIIGFGIGIIAFLAAFPISLGTIAVAWLFYRPIFAVILFIIVVAIIWFIIYKIRKNEK